ncbi:hypothetical protein [Sphingomonas sp.]|uniref:hypothetical protein n=1 Tax=Sphingomonas sp. TaxID=28214 RepID=UPI003B3AE0CF
MLKIFSVTAVLLGFTGSALAQTPTAMPAAAVAERKGHDKLICQSMVATGTRLGTKKICLSKLDWEARQKQDRDWLNETSRARLFQRE